MKKGDKQVNNYFSSVKLRVLRGEILSRLLLTAFLLLSLFLTACPDTINPPPSQADPGKVQPLPAGYGSFTPIIAHNASRTILPAAPALSDFTRFELKFTPVGDQGGALTIEQPYADSDVLEPILLVAGTYNLIVSAYKVSEVAARGTLKDIAITDAANKSGTVILYALFGEGAGTFIWNIMLDTSPIKVKTAVMTIKDSNGTEQGPSVDLLAAAGGSRSLPSGLYTVVFTMESADNPPQTLEWNDLLYIYAELESKFSISFTAAHFTDTHWNVTFNENYTGGSSSEKSVMHGATVSAPATPSRTGYTFGGWYREAAAVTLWDFDESVTDNVILYAKWTANTYTVTFNKNNTDSGSTDANPSTKTVTYPVTTVDALPTAPTRTGYTFNGWNTQANGSGTAFVQTMAVTASITVYAQWISAFTNIDTFKTWLTDQSTVSTAYTVALNMNDFGGTASTLGSVGNTLRSNEPKSVYLDLSGNAVTSIGDQAFNYCRYLTGITIGNNVTSIGNLAFYQCFSLTSVTIGNSVTSIGDNAFSNCSSLTSITIPKSVTNIGKQVFFQCTKLTAINVDANNTMYSSQDGVLYNKSKTTLIQYPAGKTDASFIIPNSVTNIEDYAFSNCSSLTNITIPDSVINIGNNTFIYSRGLTAINVNANNNAYSSQDGVLYNKNKTTLIAYPGGKTGAFIIPSSVTSIGNAFYTCASITSVTIPNSVTSIGSFYGCTSLTSVTFEGTIASGSFISSAFSNLGDLRDKFYATNTANGTPGTYTRAAGGSTWTKN